MSGWCFHFTFAPSLTDRFHLKNWSQCITDRILTISLLQGQLFAHAQPFVLFCLSLNTFSKRFSDIIFIVPNTLECYAVRRRNIDAWDIQYWSLLNWQNLRLRCGCVAVPENWFFYIISSFFAKFKNVVHSLEPGETPSNSASHQAPNYVQHS